MLVTGDLADAEFSPTYLPAAVAAMRRDDFSITAASALRRARLQ